MNIDKIWNNIALKRPLVHCITNFVTATDCANELLYCGAKPIMTTAPEEAEDIASIADSLLLNIGTANCETEKNMLIAGAMAGKMNKPIVLDPVGAGASVFRSELALKLLRELPISVVKGNYSEIKALKFNSQSTCGVDATEADQITENNIDDIVNFAKSCAKAWKTIVVISGKFDVISDGVMAVVGYNGTFKLTKITGTGCLAGALIAACGGGTPSNLFEAAVTGTLSVGICGELAEKKLVNGDGIATFRNYFLDMFSVISGEVLLENAKYKTF